MLTCLNRSEGAKSRAIKRIVIAALATVLTIEPVCHSHADESNLLVFTNKVHSMIWPNRAQAGTKIIELAVMKW